MDEWSLEIDILSANDDLVASKAQDQSGGFWRLLQRFDPRDTDSNRLGKGCYQMTAGPPDPLVAVIDDSFSRFEAKGWNDRAPTYDQFLGRLTSRVLDQLLDAAGVASGSRMLDVATGPGYASAAAAARGARVVGVDVAPAMLEIARRRNPGVEFREAGAEVLPFADGTFDAVVSNFLVPHLSHHELVVGELFRVLTGKGRVALTTWDTPDRMRLLGVFLDAFREAGAEPPDDIPVGPPFFRFAEHEAMARLLTDCGFTDVHVDTISFTHLVASNDELWDGILSGTVRTRAFIVGQNEQMRGRIRSAFDQLLRDHQRDDGVQIPVSITLGRGRRASES